jgi:hypothetical protein
LSRLSDAVKLLDVGHPVITSATPAKVEEPEVEKAVEPKNDLSEVDSSEIEV